MHSRHCACTRMLSLLISLTLLLTSLPLSAARADKPQVSLTCDAGGTVGVGDIVYFTITGVNTASVQLMVVTPDSWQAFFEGTNISYRITQPGLHTFIAYGVNTTDNADPAQELCMSAPIYLTAEGDAAPQTSATPEPEAMSGQLVITALVDGRWDVLQGQHFDDSSISVGVTLLGADIPADADIDVKLCWEKSSYAMVSETVSGQSAWFMNTMEGADVLLDGYYDSDTPLRVEAVIAAPDGQSITAAADFTLDNYSNEMRYVNQFFYCNGVKSKMGLDLVKWLDMTERSDTSDRINSGYLLLEQEMVHQTSFGYWIGNVYIKWLQKSLEVISSFGMSELTNLYIDETYYKTKFPNKGKKAYPYYTNLASVYSDYATELLAEIEAVGNGAAVEESISANTLLWEITYAQAAEPDNTADSAGKAFDVGDGLEKPLEMLENVIYCHNPVNANKNIFIMTSSSPVAGNSYTLTITDMMYETAATGTGELVGYPVLIYRNTYGDVGKISVAELSNRAMQGDRLELDISALQSQGVGSETFMDTIQAGTEQFLSNTVSASAGGVLGYNQDFGFTVDKNEIISFRKFGRTQTISGELIDRYGLQQYLTDTEAFYYDAYRRHGYSKSYDPDYMPKLPDYINAGLGGVTTALSWKAYFDSRNYQNTLQRAYFSAFNSVSDEYLSMLYQWYAGLEGSDVPNADCQQEAILALIKDICSTRDDSLSKAQRKMNTAIFTSAEYISAVGETVSFAADLAMMLPVVQQAKDILAGMAATKTAASVGVTKTTQLLTSFSKLSAGLALAGIGSLVMNLASSKYLSFEEDVHSTYYTKWSLYDEILDMLNEYGVAPRHQLAVDIIQALQLMKQLKYHGEDLIATYYLMDMYDDFGLDSAAAQLVLWNEMNGRSGTAKLDYNQYIAQVWVIHENVALGTVRELKDEGVKFDDLGLFEKETTSTAVGDEIIGVYLYGTTPVTYHGVELKSLPEKYRLLTKDRESALAFTGNYAVAKTAATERSGWQSQPAPADNGRMYREKRYLYSRNGLELLLTEEEFWEYSYGEEEVNRILDTYGDYDDFGLFQFKEKEEQQYVQRLLWLKLTRKYIDSFKMYDPNVSYR